MKRDLDFRDNLTNEQLLKRFKNQFDLVRYAIQLAENTVRSGRETDVWTDSQNVAFNILAEIATHKEQFVEIPQDEPMEPKSFDRPRQEFAGKSASKNSWSDEVKAFKEEKRERRTKSKTAR